MTERHDPSGPDAAAASGSPSAGFIARLAAIPGDRRLRWLVIALWLVAVVATTPFASRLTGLLDNSAASFLPAGADSLTVNELQTRFQTESTITAVVVYQRDEGLTDADLAKIEQDRQGITGQLPQAPIAPTVPSGDGRAALLIVTLPDDEAAINDGVAAIRDVTGSAAAGLDVKVTGPAGFGADLGEVFNGINGRLLISTAIVVALILLITYRSPILWLIPLVVVALADRLALAGVYGLADTLSVPVNGQSVGILPILVFGAGTDYALLLIARYREELRLHERPSVAMAVALRRAGPAILASAGTVVIGLLCLLAADLNSNRSIGPVGAAGIVFAVIAMLTLLPAILTLLGRRVFWPFVPHYGSQATASTGIWGRVASWVDRGPRRVWVGTALVLAIMAATVAGINTNLNQNDQFTGRPDSVLGQELIAESFPAGASSPTTVIANAAAGQAVQAELASLPGVAAVAPNGETDGLVRFAVTLTSLPGTEAAYSSVQEIRDRLATLPGAGALVGGSDAENYDVQQANNRDRLVVIPLVLLAVFIILGILLRSIVAPVLLVATVVLSYLAALGVAGLFFEYVLDFPAMDPGVPLLGFVFLVALGVDYNIFLMSRVFEESGRVGTRLGVMRGLTVTGGVITSAGVVLAATFAVLGVLPLVALAQLGFLVGFGVLLDTLVVRSLLVPALTLELGDRVWWPGPLSRRGSRRHGQDHERDPLTIGEVLPTEHAGHPS